MDKLRLIEWLGALFGLAGAFLLALNIDSSGWGFALFLASNMAWLAFGFATGAWGMVTMQVGLTITSVLGLVRWFG